ncbi:hypothetical protein HIM_05716 [Hirsutella minnesotensis 3608]|uniref:Rad21/Rec8-like protein N-terminal domain-containing protein n=1 Tax=Hirsutella minnesotensis 3608 TaxID=1043627 RepID=A0A0F7ZZV2_9HYPO|nr:hypothetical protein HIM_05716 [Hirsutella minnesotensis 3608]
MSSAFHIALVLMNDARKATSVGAVLMIGTLSGPGSSFCKCVKEWQPDSPGHQDSPVPQDMFTSPSTARRQSRKICRRVSHARVLVQRVPTFPVSSDSPILQTAGIRIVTAAANTASPKHLWRRLLTRLEPIINIYFFVRTPGLFIRSSKPAYSAVMFYSHEILSNSQYGVSTVWLAATIGKGAGSGKGVLRRLTRKAVQGVDVPKACETILNPGAPLALRLQGSLLYGVSRVFAEQCRYMLSDTEKTQSDMMTFFRALQTNELDTQAGKTKRHTITLEDDPSFDIFGALPSLELLGWDKELAGVPSQGSTCRFSFMTPYGAGSQESLSSAQHQPFISPGPPSSFFAGSYHLPSDLGHYSSPLAKRNRDLEAMPEFQPFGDDELEPIGGVGLEFDADGNLIGIIEPEPELPPLPGIHTAHAGHDVAGEVEEQPILEDGGDLVFNLGEPALPDAEAFPIATALEGEPGLLKGTSTTTETEQASAELRRGRRRKHQPMIDLIHRVSREEFRGWTENYVQNMNGSHQRLKATTPAQAKKNALALLYGNRIAGIGALSGNLGISHPLAEEFSGRALKAQLQGVHPSEIDCGFKDKRGRRRKSAEAFEQQDAAQDAQRNVRQRVDDDAELGRGADLDDGDILFGNDSIPEMGMDAVAPMEDQHSSSMLPWSRPPSVSRGQGSAQKGGPSPSPLHGRGSAIRSIEHHSDPAEAPFGAMDHVFRDSSIGMDSLVGELDLPAGDDAPSWGAGLDSASQAFMEYAAEQASAKGVARQGRGGSRRWIDFEELASPEEHSKAVAAQAFLHVLSLATKNAVAVEQDGAANNEPFGALRIGVPAPPRRAMSEDELA